MGFGGAKAELNVNGLKGSEHTQVHAEFMNHMATDEFDKLQIPAGSDRFNQNNLVIWGLIPFAIKLSSKDTGGKLFLFEHRDMGKGGPPRHIHFEQDEWFYVIKGDFAFEIGDREYRLGAGDSLLAPRNIAHGWAHVGDTPGTLLTMVTPAGTFEDFILDTTRHATLPSPAEIDKAFLDHGMKVVGPPLLS